MVDKILLKLTKCQIPTEDEVQTICDLATDIFIKEENVLYLPSSITICGDVHGQLYDLFELLKIGGLPPYTNYLFMGDYVDRGFHSVETLTFLLCLKIKYPDRIFLLRGNHESRQITQVYGFFDECIRKYGSSTVWKLYTDLFDFLPIAAVIDNSIFCCHGGLSPSFVSLDQLRRINRQQEVPHEGAMADILWSDPDDKNGWGASPRGAGFIFGPDITQGFLEKNKLSCISRAHQLVQSGFCWNHENICVTVFSAPNYCGRCENLAALLMVDEKRNYDFVQFNPSPVKFDNFTAPKVPDYFM